METTKNIPKTRTTTSSNKSEKNKGNKVKANIQRFNTLYIINILRLYSSKEHPMSTKEIIDKIDATYDPGQLIETAGDSKNGRLINRSTVQRQLESFICCSEFLNDMHAEEFFSPHTQENDIALNFKIHVMEKLPTENVMYRDVTEQIKREYMERLDKEDELAFSNKKSNTTRKAKSKMLYYYYEPCISTDELNDLIRTIETYPNYTATEVAGRIKKLRSIAPGYFYNEHQSIPMINTKNRPQPHAEGTSKRYKLAHAKHQNPLQFNLHILHQCIHQKKDIKIVYGYYNEKKQLVPRRGYDQGPHRITPYHIVCTNGQYYLVAYNPYRDNATMDEPGIMQYRIDRIIEIHQLNDKDEPGNIGPESRKISFHSALDYTKTHPLMMAGRTGRVSFFCRKSSIIVNKLIDFFGYDRFDITRPDPQLFVQTFSNKQERIDDWIHIVCSDVAYDSARMWAKQYCADCVVYQPASLKNEIEKELQAAYHLYQ